MIAIGETMRKRLEEKGAPAERLRVISNWVEASVITPQPKDNEWSRAHGMYWEAKVQASSASAGRRGARPKSHPRAKRRSPARVAR